MSVDGTATPLLEVSGIELAIGGLRILRGISFDVAEGEFFTVIGPNGAGKTSLLNVLSLIYRPTAGSVRYQGRDLLAERRSALAGLGIARTFQNLALFEDMDVMDNVVLGRHRLLRSGCSAAPCGSGGRSARSARHARRAIPSSTSWGSATTWPSPSATCPTASRSASSWPARSRSSRACCCSTSPPPA